MRKMWKKIAAFVVAAAVGIGALPTAAVMAAYNGYDNGVNDDNAPIGLTAAYSDATYAGYYLKVEEVSGGSGDGSQATPYKVDVYYVASFLGAGGIELTVDDSALSGTISGTTSVDFGDGGGSASALSYGYNLTPPTTNEFNVEVTGGTSGTVYYAVRFYPVALLEMKVGTNGAVDLGDTTILYNQANIGDFSSPFGPGTNAYLFDPEGVDGSSWDGDQPNIAITPDFGYVIDTAEWVINEGAPVDLMIGNNYTKLGGSLLYNPMNSSLYQLNVTFAAAPLYGVVDNGSGVVPDALVVLCEYSDGYDILYDVTYTNASGEFTFPVAPDGDYWIYALAKDHKMYDDYVTLPTNQNLGNISLTYAADTTHVCVRAVDGDGYGIGTAKFTLLYDDSTLVPDGDVGNGNPHDADPEGYTIFSNLDSASGYRVQASAAGYTSRTVDIPASALTDPIQYTEIVMSPQSTTSTGGSGTVSSHRSRSQTSYSGTGGTAGIPQTTGNTTPQYTEQARQAAADNKTAATIKTLGNSIDIGADTLSELISSGLDLLIQFGNNYAVLIPNSVLQQLGSGEAVRFMMEKATPSQGNLDEGAKLNPKNRDLMSRTAVEVNAYRAGERITSFGGQYVTIVANLAGFELTDAEKANMAGVSLDNNMQRLPGKWTSAKDFAYQTNHFSKFAVMIADAPVKAVDLRMTLGSTAYTLNGARKTLPVAPDVVEDRVMVPLRFVEEAFGADVSWDDATKTATVTMDGKTVSVTVGQMSAGMDVAPVIVGDRVLVPLRFISQALGSEVAWNEDMRTIDIAK